MTIDPCGPDCIAQDPILDTASGREHDNCPDPQCCALCGTELADPSSESRRCATCELARHNNRTQPSCDRQPYADQFERYMDTGIPMSRPMTPDEAMTVYLELK